MAIKMYREYRLKFYLNARHYIIINGRKGEVHPHTWEFTLNIRFGRSSFVEFNTFEKGISDFLAPYQNKVMNEIPPFDSITPTLENMADWFANEFRQVIHDIGGILLQIEASETPTRSYILGMEDFADDDEMDQDTRKQICSEVMDAVLDRLVQ